MRALKNSLGKGLSALFETASLDALSKNDGDAVLTVRISEIEPDKNQPRKEFDEEKIEELASSIKMHGIIQPIIVRSTENGRYSISAGERRWRAARIAGLTEMPCIVREYNERQAAEVALIENLQREDLNPVEQARAYRELIDKYSLTQEDLASVMGKSRPLIANTLRLLILPEKSLALLEKGDISEGQAKVLLSLADEEKINAFAQKAATERLTVRQLEELIKKKPRAGRQVKIEDTLLKDLARQLSDALGRKVKITSGASKGKIELEFYSEEDLNAIAELLMAEEF